MQNQEGMDPEHNRRVTRRTLLKGGVAAAAAVAAGAGAIAAASDDPRSPAAPKPHADPPPRPRTDPTAARRRVQARPNILVIVVDQMRTPQWLTPPGFVDGMPPALAQLSSEGVSFVHHYTASNDCTPARSTLLTGLYTHQTGCMITGGSTLDPGFPTWGTMLREHGYQARWYGKWHLTHHDNKWNFLTGPPALERYGFAGGTFPSPDGAPGQGWRVDPVVLQEFQEWYAQEGDSGPWCTTVSFVNPHDIAWWYVWSDRVPAEASAPALVSRLPPNFETPEELLARHKPQLQRSLQATAATSFGPVPFHGADAQRRWLQFQDLYVKLQMQVDTHIAGVLGALQSRPEVAAETIVVFTSDHGEYGGAHGLRGKGASAYEEATRVPLIVKDPRGTLTAAIQQPRTQLTSSVDVAPLLLTIASGSNAWREDPRYSHLSRRADLAGMLADPAAPGRPYVLHATDEIVTEFAIEPYAADAPLHVAAIRTPAAKYAVYSHWERHTTQPIPQGAEVELYDYGTQGGRLEIENTAGQSELEPELRHVFERAVVDELRETLAPELHAAREAGFADYFSTARQAARSAAARRKVRSERVLGRLPPGDTGDGRRR